MRSEQTRTLRWKTDRQTEDLVPRPLLGFGRCFGTRKGPLWDQRAAAPKLIKTIVPII